MSVSIELKNGTITGGSNGAVGEGSSTPLDVSALNVISVAGGGGGSVTNGIATARLTATIDKGEADVFIETSEAATGAPWRQLGETIRIGFHANQSLSKRISVGGVDNFLRCRWTLFNAPAGATLVVSGTGS